jgi:anaerobic selenocysteine-containing dehydrogenase
MAACTTGAAELRAHALQPEHSPERAAEVTGIAAEQIAALARTYASAGRNGTPPAAIRLNYGIQRAEYGGTAVRAVAMLPLVTGAWKYLGGGLQLTTSGAFPFNSDALQMPELMLTSPLAREARIVNMSRLGEALTTLGQNGSGGPPVKALFVYNSNPAAVAPNQNSVLRGMMRPDLFTVVHEQFFTDTADYADVLLPAPTFLEVKDVQGAYGHFYAQLSQQAIQPLGEARSNVRLFAELAQRMGFTERCFHDDEDALIDQALATDPNDPRSAWFTGVTRDRLQREGHVPLALPANAGGRVLPFSTPAWFQTASGRGELTPVPIFTPPAESRGGAAARSGEYPLEFLPRKSDNYMNSTFANIPRHQRMEARHAGVLEMHPADAAARGITTGDAVDIFNARGRIRLRAQVADAVPQGVVSARLNWTKLTGEANNVNALTSETVTDIGAGATFYSTLVEVRKV